MRWLIVALLIASGVLNATAATHTKPKKARSAPRSQVNVVYSWEYCAPCKTLEAHIRAKGVKVRVDTLAVKPYGVIDFPTVLYTNGGTDTGQRIYSGNANLGKEVLILKWVGK